MTVKVLATDLDGTLIPLDESPQNRSDLAAVQSLLKEHGIPLVFVTGRHAESVLQAIQDFSLPQPDAIICDVGTTILTADDGGKLVVQPEYERHLSQLVDKWPADAIRAAVSWIAEIKLQEKEKQGLFKVSFYTAAADVERRSGEVRTALAELSAPWSLISSVDPFNGDGLIDLLPNGVSKSYAIDWFAKSHQWDQAQILFTGDSGNDLAALTAGFRAAVVANAADEVKTAAREAHAAAGWNDRLLECQHPATSGVLEALRHFLATT
ncbi:HAD-IIB family hydrolase [Fuerstiella marisgermanici]|uniref:Mannosylfructose-phosphate phosphatase n=1 Tax=Fuerstiella marisgermanici TaxID=1891926 RepID=A0A1P8WHY2_9PLAN|nr:HAD-IIB family hydrolase [Fuerstiella marisgermanici]APZ93670.1 Mannosylfructose-phosphate phosphatase [Fuerstiella marisgermanici]